MIKLDFNLWILGNVAASRLLRKQVTQTLRSDELLARYYGLMEVSLGGRLVGTARKVSTEKVKFDDLTLEDAQRGGFDSLPELASALKRAGYRFKPLEEYPFYRIRFEWAGGKR